MILILKEKSETKFAVEIFTSESYSSVLSKLRQPCVKLFIFDLVVPRKNFVTGNFKIWFVKLVEADSTLCDISVVVTR